MNYKCTAYAWGLYLLISDHKRATEIADELCELGFCVTKVEIKFALHMAAITILDDEPLEKLHQINAIMKQYYNEQ